MKCHGLPWLTVGCNTRLPNTQRHPRLSPLNKGRTAQCHLPAMHHLQAPHKGIKSRLLSRLLTDPDSTVDIDGDTITLPFPLHKSNANREYFPALDVVHGRWVILQWTHQSLGNGMRYKQPRSKGTLVSMASGFWQRQRTAIFDVRITTDTDARSAWGWDYTKVLAVHEK